MTLVSSSVHLHTNDARCQGSSDTDNYLERRDRLNSSSRIWRIGIAIVVSSPRLAVVVVITAVVIIAATIAIAPTSRYTS